jgi:hypothetical protein
MNMNIVHATTTTPYSKFEAHLVLDEGEEFWADGYDLSRSGEEQI